MKSLDPQTEPTPTEPQNTAVLGVGHILFEVGDEDAFLTNEATVGRMMFVLLMLNIKRSRKPHYKQIADALYSESIKG